MVPPSSFSSDGYCQCTKNISDGYCRINTHKQGDSCLSIIRYSSTSRSLMEPQMEILRKDKKRCFWSVDNEVGRSGIINKDAVFLLGQHFHIPKSSTAVVPTKDELALAAAIDDATLSDKHDVPVAVKVDDSVAVKVDDSVAADFDDSVAAHVDDSVAVMVDNSVAVMVDNSVAADVDNPVAVMVDNSVAADVDANPSPFCSFFSSDDDEDEDDYDDDDEDEDDDGCGVISLKDLVLWPMCQYPDMTFKTTMGVEMTRGSRAYVCAKKKVVLVDCKTWDVYFIDLLAGMPFCLPPLIPEDYMAFSPPPGLPVSKMPWSLDNDDDHRTCMDLIYQNMKSCKDGFIPTNKTPAPEVIVKFVLSDVVVEQDGTRRSILIAMLNPEVGVETKTWGDKLFAYHILYEKEEEQQQPWRWTPVFAFAPMWTDGMFHNSEFLLLTFVHASLPYRIRTFSFQGVHPGEQPQVMKSVALDSGFSRSLRSYDAYQLALVDDKLYLVCCYVGGCDYGFHCIAKIPPNKELVKVFRTSYPNYTDSDDSVPVYQLEPVTDLGGKALFLSDGNAFSIEPDNAAVAGSVQPDTVYFSPRDNVSGEPRTPSLMPPLGLFNLKTQQGQVIQWDHALFPGRIPMFV